MKLYFNHIEIFLARSTNWTLPVFRNIGPGRSRINSFIWSPFLFVIDPSTHGALKFFHNKFLTGKVINAGQFLCKVIIHFVNHKLIIKIDSYFQHQN